MENKNKPVSTFERMMQDEKFKNEFYKGYKDFVISELILSLMKKDNIVNKNAKIDRSKNLKTSRNKKA